MTKLAWDKTGERVYELGVDHGVLYLHSKSEPGQPTKADYKRAFAWNGLTAVNETPEGAEANPQYADNIKYLNLYSAEEFNATVEAYTYPPAFGECDGSVSVAPGVTIGQQSRAPFGLSYRTKVGDDVDGQDAGYKIHIIYGAMAAPSEKNYETVNDSPEAATFSWELTTTPIDVEGYKPTSTFVFDSRDVDPSKMALLETALYGSDEAEPYLPLPTEIIEMMKDS